MLPVVSAERRLAAYLAGEFAYLEWTYVGSPLEHLTPQICAAATQAISRRVEDAVRHTAVLVNGPRFQVARDNDEVEWQGGRVYLQLGARRDDPPRG